MTEPVGKANGRHYVWGGDCDGWHLVEDGQLSVIHERMPPGRREVRHRHARSRQFFFVLAGVLTLEVDGRRHTLGAGLGLEIAPGMAHQALNTGDGHVEFLVVSSPPTAGDRTPA